jgi:hypothetical protein
MDCREKLEYSSSQVNAGVKFVLCGKYFQTASSGTNTMEWHSVSTIPSII